MTTPPAHSAKKNTPDPRLVLAAELTGGAVRAYRDATSALADATERYRVAIPHDEKGRLAEANLFEVLIDLIVTAQGRASETLMHAIQTHRPDVERPGDLHRPGFAWVPAAVIIDKSLWITVPADDGDYTPDRMHLYEVPLANLVDLNEVLGRSPARPHP